jgi:hypothetical protein
MPPTPPNVQNLPHDVADFVVSVVVAANVDDDRAAQIGSTLTERAAEWLLRHGAELRTYVVAELDAHDAATVSVLFGPRGVIEQTRARLLAELDA